MEQVQIFDDYGQGKKVLQNSINEWFKENANITVTGRTQSGGDNMITITIWYKQN